MSHQEASQQGMSHHESAARLRLLNNVGCIQQRQGKLHTAALLFADAQRMYSDLGLHDSATGHSAAGGPAATGRSGPEPQEVSSSAAVQTQADGTGSAPDEAGKTEQALRRGLPGMTNGLGIRDASGVLLNNGALQAHILGKPATALAGFEVCLCL